MENIMLAKTGFALDHNDLADMPSSSNSDHDGRYYTETEIGSTIDPTGASLVGVASITDSTYLKVQDFINIKSSGKISGGELTAGTAVVNVAAGIGMIKITDSPIGINKFFDWEAVNNISLTDDSLNYIYVNYNVSTEAITILSTTTLENMNLHTQIPIGLAFRDGDHVEILDNGAEIIDFEATEWHRLAHRGIERMSGAEVAESGTRFLTITAGSYYKITKHINTDAIDTTGADTFTAVYRDGSGNWTFDTGHSQFSNILYDDGDGTPGNVGVAKYATYYVYQCLEGDTYIQYGQNNLNTLTTAQNESIPTPPNYLNSWAQLRAKIIILRGATNATSVSGYEKAGFTSFAAGVHNELGGLQGGTTDEYYHLTSAQHTDVPLNTTHRDSDGKDHSDVVTNSAKVTNATHTGEVTGSTGLAVDKTAITGKDVVTAIGADYVLISDTGDTGNLKKALVSDFASAGGDMAAATYDPTSVVGDCFDMDNMAEGATTKILTDTERTAISNNTAKDTNVTTNLSLGSLNPTTMDVNSSDGTNATLVEADTTNAGLLGSDKWDEIVANTTHSGGDGSDHADVATNTAASHAESHNMASHSDDDTYNINTTGTATVSSLTVLGNDILIQAQVGSTDPTRIRIDGTNSNKLTSMQLNSSNSSGYFWLQNDALQWEIRYDTTVDTLGLRRYVGGAYQDNVWDVAQATGKTTYHKAIEFDGAVEFDSTTQFDGINTFNQVSYYNSSTVYKDGIDIYFGTGFDVTMEYNAGSLILQDENEDTVTFLINDFLLVDITSDLKVRKKIYSGQRTITPANDGDAVDVSAVNSLIIDCTDGAVVIGAFTGGVAGQVLSIARINAVANDVTLEHNEGTGNQNIFLHTGADETLNAEYGGWTLVCDGTSWFDASH